MEESSGGVCGGIEARFSPQKAMRAQRLLASKLILRDAYGPIRRVAGLDVAYARRGRDPIGVGVAVLLSYPSLRVEHCIAYVGWACIPYIPGLLAFREMSLLAPAVIRLEEEAGADLYVVDGHGIAHPRGLGIASHVGIAMDKPSIGVAKKRLYGREEERAGRRVLVDDSGNVIAYVLESGRGSRIYVSPGHRITPASAASLVASMLRRGHRLPEPTRIADRVSKQLRRLIASGSAGPGFIDCSSSSFPHRSS